MPEQYKISQDPTVCYREYYLKNKSRFAKWKNTNPIHQRYTMLHIM